MPFTNGVFLYESLIRLMEDDTNLYHCYISLPEIEKQKNAPFSPAVHNLFSFQPLLNSFHNHPCNINGRKKGGKSFIKKENMGGQQVQWVLLILPDWHLFCHFLVTPLPPQSTWFRCGANCRSKHMIQA